MRTQPSKKTETRLLVRGLPAFRSPREARFCEAALLSLILAVFAQSRELGAQDVLSVASASAASGDVVVLPVSLLDRSGTPLDLGGDAEGSIDGLVLTITPSLPALVEAIDFERAGILAASSPRLDTQVGDATRKSWVLAFGEGLSVGSGTQQFGMLRLRLAADAPVGSEIELSFDQSTTGLSNAAGTVLESKAAGTLDLVGGRIDVVGKGCTTEVALCLLQDRFSVEVSWTDFAGAQGVGRPARLTDDSGSFWFFNSDNTELVIKVLDGRALNGNFWVFYGALSNVEYEITVTDTVTGQRKSYLNPSGEFASVGDTAAFETGESLQASAAEFEVAPIGLGSSPSGSRFLEKQRKSLGAGAGGICLGDETHFCLLDRRFELSVRWTDFRGGTGVGRPRVLSRETGYFWFFDPDNVELVVKTLDARALNGHFWVFYGALSNVDFTLDVLDTVTGIRKQYSNPSGTFASVGDTTAFPVPE